MYHCFGCKGEENFRHLQGFCKKFSTIMSKIISRIQEFAENQGISIRELERKSRVTNGVFSKAIRFGNEISTDKVENLLQAYPSISAEWLLRGEGEMLLSSTDSANDIHVKYLERKVSDQEILIRELYQEIGMLKKELSLAGKRETARGADGSSVADAV